MELRQILANRLRQMMDSSVTLDTQTKVANRSGVGQSTIQRLLTLEQAATVDMLEKISRAFGLEPWEMLTPSGVDVDLLRQIKKLGPGDKSRILAFIDLTVSMSTADQHHPMAQYKSSPGQTVPAQLVAAKNSASARKPGADIEIKTNHGKAEQKRRGGKGL